MGLVEKMAKNYNTYQFEFVEVKKTVHGYDEKQLKLENHTRFKYFKLPEGMTDKEAYNVLSYLYNKVSHTLAEANDKNITKERLIINVNANLANFHFTEVEVCENAKKLYVVQADKDWKTALRYSFKGEKWYNANVTEEEIAEIYSCLLGVTLPSVQIVDNAEVIYDSYTNFT